MEGRPVWVRMIVPTVLFGAIGFGLGYVWQVLVGAGVWTAAVALSGFGAGTGAGLGAERQASAFRGGIVGALVGLVIGGLLDVFDASLGAAASTAFLLAMGLGGWFTFRAGPDEMKEAAGHRRRRD